MKLMTITACIQMLILSVAGMLIDTPKGTVDFQREKLGVEKQPEGLFLFGGTYCKVRTYWPKDQNEKNVDEYININKTSYDYSIFPHLAEQLRKLGYKNVKDHPNHCKTTTDVTFSWEFEEDEFKIYIEIYYDYESMKLVRVTN